jgi:hypothetical protein
LFLGLFAGSIERALVLGRLASHVSPPVEAVEW